MRWLVPIAVLAAAGWWLTPPASTAPPGAREQPSGVAWTMFDCEGDRRFVARVGEGGTEIYFPDGRRAVVPDGGSRPYAGGTLSLDAGRASFAKGGARVDCETRAASLQIELVPNGTPP